MIKIKAWYGDWREATDKEAMDLAHFIYSHCNVRSEDIIRIINEKHIRGKLLTSKELKEMEE